MKTSLKMSGEKCCRIAAGLGSGALCLLLFFLAKAVAAQSPLIVPCASEAPAAYWPRVWQGSLPREPVTLSVVVHVLYQDEEQNLSDEQIYAQIEELNRAFHEDGSGAAQLLPPFRPLLADLELQFCLASLDPDGNPTNGITRTPVAQAGMGLTEAVFFSALGGVDNWDAARYINIRVVDMGGSILGKATFPDEATPEKDGLLIDWRVFGLSANGAPHGLGRTAVHEMGHYFGLLHPWGEGNANCENDDGLEDTPRTSETYLGECPSGLRESCGSADMYTNYMYYSDDACLWQFTPEQKGVVWNTLLHERLGLLSGEGCSSPLPGRAAPQAFRLWPNPFEGKANLQWEGVLEEEVQLFLYDAAGRLLLQWRLPAGSSAYAMDLRDLPAGLYFLRVKAASGGRVVKIEKAP